MCSFGPMATSLTTATLGSALSHGGVIISGSGDALIGGPGAPACAIAVVLAGSAIGGIAGSMAADGMDEELEEFSKWEVF